MASTGGGPPSADEAIHVYFDFISPYGWIGAEKVGAIARRHGRPLVWHPILLKVTVLDTMGLPPPLDTPLKGSYLRRDIARSLRFHDLELDPQARLRFTSVLPARAVLWARAQAPELVERLVLALYRTHWAGGSDISDAETTLDVIAAAGLPRSAAAAALQSEAMRQALRDETALAIAAGVFGSPTFVVDGEPFWGADRLSMLEEWIRRGGW